MTNNPILCTNIIDGHPDSQTIYTYLLNTSNRHLMELTDCLLRNTPDEDLRNRLNTFKLDYPDEPHFGVLLDMLIALLQNSDRDTLLELCYQEATRRFMDKLNREALNRQAEV